MTEIAEPTKWKIPLQKKFTDASAKNNGKNESQLVALLRSEGKKSYGIGDLRSSLSYGTGSVLSRLCSTA